MKSREFKESRKRFDSTMANNEIQVVIINIEKSKLVNIGTTDKPKLKHISANDVVTFRALHESDEKKLETLFK